MLNNADWLLNLNYVELLREVGACFSVNNMLRAECYKQRMANGLSFLEFNYMIMQSYDFYHLYPGNTAAISSSAVMTSGAICWAARELIRRKLGKDDAEAMTITLLLNSEGKKMGKTVSGAVWLDPEKTSPYDFYQYWRNVDDADVIKCMKMLTDLSLEEIAEMETWKDSRINRAKEILAFELTKLVHGEEEARKAEETAKSLFSTGGDLSNMPTTTLSAEDVPVDIVTLLVKTGLAPSKSEARRLVQQNSVSVNNEKVTDIAANYTADDLSGDGLMLKKGKKVFHRVVLG